MSAKRVKFDTLRSLAYTGISGTYATVGSALTINPRMICISNNTDGDLIFSLDNTNASGNVFVAAGGFKLYDYTANIDPVKDDGFVEAIGDQWYVKQISAPTKGAVYIEFVYA